MFDFKAFREIHLAYDNNTKQFLAIKYKIASDENPQLRHEHSILEQLNKQENNNPVSSPKGTLGMHRVYLFDRMESNISLWLWTF